MLFNVVRIWTPTHTFNLQRDLLDKVLGEKKTINSYSAGRDPEEGEDDLVA